MYPLYSTDVLDLFIELLYNFIHLRDDRINPLVTHGSLGWTFEEFRGSDSRSWSWSESVRGSGSQTPVPVPRMDL